MNLRLVVSVVVLVIVVALFGLRHRLRVLGGTAGSQSAPVAQAGSPAASPPAVSAAPVRSAVPPSGAARPASRIVVHAAWGSQPGELGRRRDPESNPESPMALAAGARGEVLVMDQVNRRIERYRDGARVGSIALGGDTVQDLATLPEGRVAVLDRHVDKNVQIYGADGKLVNELPLGGADLPAPGTVTGVFADANGVYVESEHAQVLQIADAAGNRSATPVPLAGRPSRDGSLLLTAAVLNPAAGQLVVRAFTRPSGLLAWERQVQLAAPVLHILLLDSDRRGQVYLAAAIGNEDSRPPYRIRDERITAVRLSRGDETGRIDLPALPSAAETFRPLSVDDDGDLYLMVPGPQGLDITRYAFP